MTEKPKSAIYTNNVYSSKYRKLRIKIDINYLKFKLKSQKRGKSLC